METIVEQTKRKARKRHSCDMCWCPIEAGSIYLYSVYKHDEIYTWKMHQHCQDIAEKLKMYDETYGEGLDSNMFNEFINDEYYNLTKNSDDEITWSEKIDFVLEHYGIKKQ
jgi:hypothetical protein